jgi:hypothetical protein
MALAKLSKIVILCVKYLYSEVKMKFTAMILSALLYLLTTPADSANIDCSEAYGKAAKCEQVTCSDKYKTFIGKWTGPFQSYSQELSTQEKPVFRPYQNEVTYSENDCLKNIANGDTFIIGRKTDTYTAFQGLPVKESKGMLITGRKVDGSPFLKTFDSENGFNEYDLVYQNNVANLSIWQLNISASVDGKSPEMRFTTIDSQDFLEARVHKRNVTVTMSMGPKQSPFWEGVVVKGFHSLQK